MELILVKDCGFCFGVRRAVDMAEQAAAAYGHVDTLGPLIHNEQELRALAPRISAVERAEDCTGKVLLIRSHGVGPEAHDHAAALGLQVIDATCPFVKTAQRMACM